MKKKLLLLTAVILAFSLIFSGCGGKDSKENENQGGIAQKGAVL